VRDLAFAVEAPQHLLSGLLAAWPLDHELLLEVLKLLALAVTLDRRHDDPVPVLRVDDARVVGVTSRAVQDREVCLLQVLHQPLPKFDVVYPDHRASAALQGRGPIDDLSDLVIVEEDGPAPP